MKPKLLILVMVLAVSAIWTAKDYFYVRLLSPSIPSQAMSLTAPELAMVSVNGEHDARLSDYRGRFVLINVWASWCVPCVAEFPDLLALANAYPALQLVTLSVDRTAEKAQAFLDKFGQPPPNAFHAFDAKMALSRDLLQVYRYPESILVNPQGQMIRRFTGMLKEEHIAEIEAALTQ